MMQKPESHGFELVTHIPLACNDIAFQGSYAYLANEWDGISIFDINKLSSPSLLGRIHLPNYAWNIKVHNNIVYVAEHPAEEDYRKNSNTLFSSSSGVLLVDISNPVHPVEINRFSAKDFVIRLFTTTNSLS
jgi:hypothetical protein